MLTPLKDDENFRLLEVVTHGLRLEASSWTLNRWPVAAACEDRVRVVNVC